MKICYLADAGSIHIQKRVGFFAGKGDEIHLISFRRGEIEKIDLHYIKPCLPFSYNLSYILSIPRIRLLVSQINPDVLHAYYATSYGFIGACCNVKPFILSCIGSDIMINSRKIGVYRSITKYALKKASFITSVSKSIKERIIQLGIDPNKIQILTFGIDPQEFFPPLQERRDFSLLSLRRLEPIYNIDTIIKGFSFLKEEGFKGRLVIVGGGPEENRLKKLSKDLKLSDGIHFVGMVPHHEVAEYLRASQIYLSMSLSDGSSTSLLEAMACGTFPIVSDIPANREWIVDGDNGFLISPFDARQLAQRIMDALNNSSFVKTASKKNVEIIQKRGQLKENLGEMALLYQKAKEARC
jgi:glycosyltransferase involved in cell wall biosynthesis